MKKNKIYESEKIIIYVKGDETSIETGYEADIAYEVFTAALIGYKDFAKRLKDQKEFLDSVEEDFAMGMRCLRKLFPNKK